MHRIDRILAHPIDLPLREPFETAQRRAITSPTVIVELISGEVKGYGEATPVKYVTGEDVATVLHDIGAAAQVLNGTPLQEYRLASRKLADILPYGKSARAAIEMALLDAFCKVIGVPLYAFLGGAALRIETDVTIPICEPAHANQLAAELASKGFRQFKVKVGKERSEDLARVQAVMEAAPNAVFNIDANQGFEPDQAVEFVRKLQSLGARIQLLEQPVHASDLEGLRYVTECAGVPVFADEAAQTPADVIDIIRHKAATGVNVKIQKAGMIGALEIKSICRAAGLELMFGCMLESRIGQSAAAHIACGTGAFTVFDLDSDLLIADQPVSGGAQRQGATLRVSNRPGLGCEIVEGALQPFIKADPRFVAQ
jgi:L-alanine-DL-glutamate epimerase-like enolase superfamily enzyme